MSRQFEALLRHKVVLEIEGLGRAHQLQSSTAIVLQPLWDDEGTERTPEQRSWLVAPLQWTFRQHEVSPKPIAAAVLARELALAVGYQEVFAESHVASGDWIRRLYACVGYGSPPFEVAGLERLFTALNPTRGEIWAAVGETPAKPPPGTTIGQDAARHAMFFHALAKRLADQPASCLGIGHDVPRED